MATGFLLYYIVVLGCDYSFLVRDLLAAAATPSYFDHQKPLIPLLDGIFKSFHPALSRYFLDKFHVHWLNVLIYFVVLSVVWIKREVFWLFLFLVSEVFFIFFFNVGTGLYKEPRYFLPFYFVYIYFAYELLWMFFHTVSKKYACRLLTVLFGVFISVSVFALTRVDKQPVYCMLTPPDFFSEYIPVYAKVFVGKPKAPIAVAYNYFHCFIDSVPVDYTRFMHVDRRFKYKVVETEEAADYAVEDIEHGSKRQNYALIIRQDKLGLFKINKPLNLN
ncbi:MAG: hypothetical protein HQL17_04455 [Candidatus Omnitrophica bacterium]|nr:hypothetical protein [Candidatus Omnitrophota bacterium]